MKKQTVLILLIVAMAALFAAAYMVYDRYGGLMTVRPPGLSQSEPDGSPGEDGPGTAAPSENGGVTGDDTDNASGMDGGPGDAGNGSQDGTAGSSTGGDGQDSGNGGGPGSVPEDSRDTQDGNPEVVEDENNGYKIMVPDFTLKDLEGNEISLSDYRGSTVVLNFWATWCIYCSEELRDLNLLDREFKKAGDAVILAVNAEEPYDKVREYVEKNDLDLTVLTDETGDVSAGLFGVFSFPNTYIISSDGSLYAYVPGRIGLDTLRKLVDMARNGEPLYGSR
ncbi:MAG: redoxin domain-containing protein [Clostridiaceae bacterium]|nr:redoxin domain-containing protein [Clostridiaceae bacterium]